MRKNMSKKDNYWKDIDILGSKFYGTNDINDLIDCREFSSMFKIKLIYLKFFKKIHTYIVR